MLFKPWAGEITAEILRNQYLELSGVFRNEPCDGFSCFVIESEVMAKHGNTSHCGWCIE
ncbi:hypothetical protein [Shewanella japonica]|uniref:hypothetical protein n=1 Tax=Shewanella japonica TaxID=93973 RepID=UPI0013C4B816|nr:hypothetical protein [Shewanella japonica]